MDALLILALLALPLSAAAVLVTVVLVAVRPRPWTAVAGAALATGLLVVWAVLSYRDGVRSDAPGAGGNIFSQVSWLVAAALSGVAALTLQKKHARRPPRRLP